MSEREDKPPTLASLRARSARLRSGKRTPPGAPAADPLFQAGLFSCENAASPNLTTPQSDRIDESRGESAGEFRQSETAPQHGSQESFQPGSAGENATARAQSVSARSKLQSPALPTERRIWSVRALVAEVRQHVETCYANLWIEGEISNCRPASSGHVYFTLKDGEAQLPVVLFRRQSQLLRFRPADGLAVLVRGRISVYETRGQLQLIAETMEPRGAGALQLAFEQLKARLLAEGLFDSARKRPLPSFPRCIGIVTSPTGAVIRDIVTVIRRRHARLNLLVFPAVMQGTSSPDSVARGIRWFNAHPGRADLIVIARGGGSMEDLACFNDEMLARTIAASALPVVSAIGHETDFTIADFVADLRAPTPSAAAELVTAAQHRIEERLDGLTSRIHRAGRFHLMHARQRYARLSAESVLVRLRDGVDRRDQLLDELQLRLESGSERRLRAASQHLSLLNARIARQNVSMRLTAAHRRLQRATERLQTIGGQAVAMRQARLTRAFTRLEALSPVAVLSRGYALIYSAEGTLLRSSGEVAVGERIHARLGRGTLDATVTQTGLNSTTDPIGLPENT
jgi:exodeoxyribonuclease VII large subunit